MAAISSTLVFGEIKKKKKEKRGIYRGEVAIFLESIFQAAYDPAGEDASEIGDRSAESAENRG